MLQHCQCSLTGIYAVGKAATRKPAFVLLSHLVEDAHKSIAWVGKGIVYDTGGLSIKGKVGLKQYSTSAISTSSTHALGAALARMHATGPTYHVPSFCTT